MQSLSVRASALGGDEGLVSVVGVPTPGRLANPYRMSVQAGTNAATAVRYSVQGVSGLGADEALYYFAPRETGPLQVQAEALVLDLAECVGGLRLRFVDANGAPVVVSGGQGFVTVGGEVRVQVLALRGGAAEVFLPVPSGVELSIGLQFRTGIDPYRDELQFPYTLTTNVACDTVLTIPVVVGAPGALGRIAGTVDMEGEFERSTGPAAFGGLLGRTALIGTGPAGNRRFDLLPGDNVTVPASGFAELENLVPSDAVQPPESWRVQAQMHFRSGRRFEYFISPALGEGLNPGLVVSGGGTTDLGDRFRMRRSVVLGTLEFAGPPDTAAVKSTLRGILRPDDAGVDAHGIPVNAAGYGITDSHVVATGQDVVAVVGGAGYTATGGRAAVNFEGEYRVDRGAFIGDFEAVVGGLGGGSSVWRRDEVHLAIATAGLPEVAEVNEVLTITDRAAGALVAVPGKSVRSDLRLGFSEVCLRFRTPGRRFHSPAVSQARGEWTGPDAWGQSQDYAVNIEAAYGLPASSATAASEGVLNLTLPQGVYRLRPSINLINEDGSETVTQLDEIELNVPARQRVCVEGCLQVAVTAPSCPTEGVVLVTGRVRTCGQAVSTVTYQVDEGAQVAACTECGVDPVVSIPVPVGPGRHTITISATDATGAVSSASVNVGPEGPAPVVASVSPARISASGGTAVVIVGSGLEPSDEILVGGQPLGDEVWISPAEVNGVVPMLAPGSHPVQVRRCGTVVATLADAVVAGSVPVLMAIEPMSGFAAGGGMIQFAGSGFTESTRIRIAVGGGTNSGWVQGLTLSPGGGLLTGTIPPLPPEVPLGTYDVVAEDPSGSSVLVGAFTYLANSAPSEDGLVEALRQLETESAEPLQVSLRHGIAEAIGGRFRVAGATPEARAVGFIEEHRAVFQLPAQGALELGVASVAREEGDHVRLVQSIGGVPVFGGEVVVSLLGDEVMAVNGALLPPGELGRAGVSLAPRLTGTDARVVAIRALGIPAPGFGVVAETELMVFDLALLDERALEPHLAHRVSLYALDREIFVDAHSGEVLLNRALSQSDGAPLNGLNLFVRDTRGLTNLVKSDCTLDGATALVARGQVNGDADDSFIEASYANDALATAVYRHSRDAYAFFHTRFGWHGFYNSSDRVLVFAHDPVSNNAFAHGCLIRIGDQLVDYEVVVHEWTHNIISAPGNSKLVYAFQPGALNESYSDIMGVSAGRLAGQTDWRIGPGLFSREFIDPTRSGMGTAPQPAHFANFVVVRADTNGVFADAGGVHSNSGIPNRAAYLLSEGMTMPNGGAPPRFQPGIGMDRMMQLKFAAMRFLPANASFAAARNFEVQYATTLSRLPFTGFGPAEVAAVRNSWFLVGVGNPDIDGNGIEETIDSDRDFVPDAVDNCRWKPNPLQEDADADGIGDACDNCPKHYNRSQSDLDRDGIGDDCDGDIDGDGCRNQVDQAPREALARIGQTVLTGFSGRCEPIGDDYVGPTSFDTDLDGRRDCEDDDDDGDGIPDAADPCPVGRLQDFFGRNFLPFPFLPLVGECGVQAICNPRLPPAVLNFGDFDHDKVIVRVRDARVNPSPERTVILQDVRIVNGSIYAYAGSGAALGGIANRILGLGGAGGRREGSPAGPVDGELRRVELWTRATEAAPARLLGVFGELDPATVSLDSVGQGRWLALRVGADGAGAQLASTWQFGGGEGMVGLDSDGDGLPDGYEIGVGLDPKDASDADKDLDGDGLDARTEYRAGTDPRSAESRFALRGISVTPDGFRVEWTAAPGQSVVLERAARPDASVWRAVGAPVRMQGDQAGMDVSGDGASEGFFRVRIP